MVKFPCWLTGNEWFPYYERIGCRNSELPPTGGRNALVKTYRLIFKHEYDRIKSMTLSLITALRNT